MWKIVFWEHDGSGSELFGSQSAVEHLAMYCDLELSLYYILYNERGEIVVDKSEGTKPANLEDNTVAATPAATPAANNCDMIPAKPANPYPGQRVNHVDFGDGLPPAGSYWPTDHNWSFVTPNGLYGGLTKGHHVQEHEDGAISVLPQPGNSNSILCRGYNSDSQPAEYHGYIRHGVWEEC